MEVEESKNHNSANSDPLFCPLDLPNRLCPIPLHELVSQSVQVRVEAQEYRLDHFHRWARDSTIRQVRVSREEKPKEARSNLLIPSSVSEERMR